MLSVADISVKIGAALVLQNVSCDLQTGENLTVVGANGAGKSTFLKSLIKLVHISQGKIEYQGKSLVDFSRQALAKIAAYLPQQVSLDLPINVYDFILFGRYAHQMQMRAYSEYDHAVCRAIVEKTNCRQFLSRSLDQLSAGERQRVLIASCLVQEPKFLLLDEPTTFLDPKNKWEIETLLLALAGELKITLVWVTHDINVVPLVNGKVLALKSGRSVYCGETAEFLQEGHLNKVFEKEYHLISHPESGKPYVII